MERIEKCSSQKKSIFPDSENDKSLADSFSNVFINKITRIRDGFQRYTHLSILPDAKLPEFNQFEPQTESETRKLIMSSPTKSCLLDPWPTFLVKVCVDSLLPSITKLVNFSLAQGLFPGVLKWAIVTPLIKKQTLPKDDMKNYPVSGLCFVSKLAEHIVASQVKCHLGQNNLGNDLQSAYKSGHSTETALLSIN